MRGGGHREPPGGGRGEVVRLLELVGLSAFAVAQPVLDVLGRSPETFAFYGAGTVWVVAFALGWIAIPPLALWLVGRAAAPLGVGVRRTLHAASIGVLLTVIAFQVIKRTTGVASPWILLAGAAVGGLAAAVILRTGVLRQWLRLTSTAAVPFVAAFLVLSPVSDLVLPPRVEAGASVEDARRVPVVFIVFDQLPTGSLMDGAGTINGRLFPSFARFADDATWYRHYTTVATHTHWAVPAMLSGKDVVLEKELTFRDHPENLFTMLANTHEMRSFGVLTHLCADLCTDVPPSEPDESTSPPLVGDDTDLGGLLRDSARAWWDMSAPYRIDRDIEVQFEEDAGPTASGSWGRFLGSLVPSDVPTLSYVHIIQPHLPWRIFPSGVGYDPMDVERVESEALDLSQGPLLLSDDQWPMQVQRQRHLLQVQNVDRLLGGAIDRLKETGLYDRALVVVTSDHGLLNDTGLDESNFHEILWTALFVKAPGQEEGRIDDSNMTMLDLLPTIADLLGTEVPWETGGTSALDPDADRGPIKRFEDPLPPWVEDNYTVTLEDALERMKGSAFRPAVPERDDGMLLYRIGPGAHLVGERLEETSIGPHSGFTASLDNPAGSFEEVDLESEIPAFVTGAVEGAGNERLVALSLNGRIAGASPTYRSGRRDGSFSLLVPEFLFRPGGNNLRLFLVEGSTLRPIDLE